MTKNETKDSNSTNKVLIFGLLVGALYLGLRDWGGDDEVLIQGATVKRGDVEITVVERGNLSAKNAASIRSEIEGRATILSMVQEGTFVEAGDVVCELDTTADRPKLKVVAHGIRNSLGVAFHPTTDDL